MVVTTEKNAFPFFSSGHNQESSGCVWVKWIGNVGMWVGVGDAGG